MRLFILGAGASKAYEQSNSAVRMPIARDFFDTFHKLDISNNPWVLRGQISQYASEKFGVDPASYFSSGIDIEEFHSSIEADWLNAAAESNAIGSLTYQAAYNELVYLFASVINEIQNGPTSLSHLKLAKRIGADDVIATFNWDTLMDKALEESKPWTTDGGYGFEPKSIYRNSWTSPLTPSTSTPRLYKLHGSTNWLTVHPSFHQNKSIKLSKLVAPEDVYVFESTEQPYSCYEGRFMNGYQRFSYGYYPVNLDMVAADQEGRKTLSFNIPKPYVKTGTSPSDGVITIPLIIPPVKDKKYDQYGNLFESLWANTGKAIELAEEIILIGYSFPKTDLKSTDLFIKAFLKRSDKPKIKIIDPMPERVVDKFKLEFGFNDSELFVYKDYFSESFDIDAVLKD